MDIETEYKINEIHASIIKALGDQATEGEDDDGRPAVRIWRRGWICVREADTGGLELTYRLSGGRGGINAALRAAGICDKYWDLTETDEVRG